jgi:hypothetical protein
MVGLVEHGAGIGIDRLIMQTIMARMYNSNPLIDNLYQQILDLRKLPEGYEQVVVTEKLFDGKIDRLDYQSDFDRITYLKNSPDAWYLDCDIVIKKWPDFELEKGYVYCYQERGCIYDTCVTFGNGQKDYFEHLYKECCEGKRYIHTVIDEDLKDRTRKIPDGYFEHLVLHAVAKQIKDGTTRQYLHCKRHGFMKINGEWKFKL